jgi:hypothetical protein
MLTPIVNLRPESPGDHRHRGARAGSAPEDRYPSAGELAAELRVVMGEPAPEHAGSRRAPSGANRERRAAPGAFWDECSWSRPRSSSWRS